MCRDKRRLVRRDGRAFVPSGPSAFLQGCQICIERFCQRQEPGGVGTLCAVSSRQAHRASTCSVPHVVTGSPGGQA